MVGHFSFLLGDCGKQKHPANFPPKALWISAGTFDRRAIALVRSTRIVNLGDNSRDYHELGHRGIGELRFMI
jgi:hypothetical protein